jgi:hypothetical protein
MLGHEYAAAGRSANDPAISTAPLTMSVARRRD